MVQVYQKKWQRNSFKAFLGYLRDSLVLCLPIKRLPKSVVRLLYGVDAQFAFLVHPRAYQDVFISAPYFKFLKFFFRKDKGYEFFSVTNPFVLNTVTTQQGVNGVVIAQLTVPELLFQERRKVLEHLKRAIKLFSKIGSNNGVVGLGGWFPMVTKRGSSLSDYASELGITVTNGHCGTLASIYMMTEKIANRAGIPQDELIIAVIGVGKMGTNVARAFNGKVKRLILIDINQGNLNKVKEQLDSEKAETSIDIVISSEEEFQNVRAALRESHIGVCATSSLRNLLKIRDMPNGYVAIDDSRPEALPRDPKNERLVIEGGLLKVKGATVNYNYGFGENDNVFGCLGEAFVLALDKQRRVQPTLGDVNMDNFHEFLKVCRENQVESGDLKSSHHDILDDDLLEAFKKRGFISKSQHDVKKIDQ